MNLSKESIEEKVFKTACGCWLWPNDTQSRYFAIYINGKVMGIHRATFELFKGPIEKGFCVLHTCDIMNCVNPNHLFLGTQHENMIDKVSKNRQAKGNEVGTAKLNAEQVYEIRYLLEEGSLTQAIIGSLYGVDRTLISAINTRKIWRHL